MTKQDIIDYVLKTPSNTNPAVLDTMLNELSDDSSEGSSDFTTAEVTIINTTENYVQFGSFAIIDSEDYFNVGDVFLDSNSSERYQFVMYKGSTPYYYHVYLFGASEATGTGDISIEEVSDPETGDVSWEVHITGDCTITIS